MLADSEQSGMILAVEQLIMEQLIMKELTAGQLIERWD
jgi:hypothetical protein